MATSISPTFPLERIGKKSQDILDEVEKAVIGKRRFLEKVLCALLARGHVLIEDFPGLAKTLTARSFARVLGLQFKRIQFTPDLLPADVTGTYIFKRQQGEFELIKGPIFANLVLGDEINRTPPKTQSAMLEAMEEHQITLEGASLKLPQPFMVIATQNPIEYEGTFPLPEAQLDRFMLRLSVGYPAADEEFEVLKRYWERHQEEPDLGCLSHAEELNAMCTAVEYVRVDPDVARYMVSLVRASRERREIAVGASPRASLALLKLSRAKAALDGRDYVIPDDVKFFAREVFVHRLLLQPDMWVRELAVNDVVEDILRRTPVPRYP
ncbi:MAG: MoxR family ATPase [Candidatus Vecturithrix sp.]|jgi:MoxR-like ATPase|nr:MoxR family ATPase [Candidatus Vecturithrix sp.]